MHIFFCSLLSKTFKVFLFLKFSNYITLLQWTNYISGYTAQSVIVETRASHCFFAHSFVILSSCSWILVVSKSTRFSFHWTPVSHWGGL